VVEALSKAGIANLEEFRFFFNAEAKVEPWLGKIQLGAEAQIQAARLRRAWHSVSLCYKTAEQDRSRVAIEDLGSLLGDTELRSAKEAFWVRYKLKFPTEVYPSDAAVSRASREMSKRLLCVTAVWKVKTLQWQLGTSSKKRKLGPDDEQPGHQDWETYLDRLFTLLLAYALGGVKALDNAPPAKEEDVLGADTTKFVYVPLDVVMRYHARARRTSASLPYASRLAWLQQRDTEERADSGRLSLRDAESRSQGVSGGEEVLRAIISMRPRRELMVLPMDDRVLQHTPVLWAASALGQIDVAVSVGATICIAETLDQDVLRELQPTVLGVVPSSLESLQPAEAKTVRWIFTWGETLPPALGSRWAERRRVVELLISTEYWLSLYSAGRSSEGRSIYKAVPGAEVAVATDGQVQRHVGATGELCLRGPMVTTGYRGLEGSSFIDAGDGAPYFKTSDL
ncbi:unnamed protein product, partial [Effrenium voratum]